MERISVPPDVLSQIAEASFPAEIADDAGKRVAVVLPPDLFREMFDIYCDKVFGPPGQKTTAADVATAVTTEELVAHIRALEARLSGAA
jgi:hypothetical protein